MSDEIYDGLVMHGIMNRWHHKVDRDPFDTVIEILTNGFVAEMDPNNPNARKYPLLNPARLFSHTHGSTYSDKDGDAYAIVFDPPLDQRINARGGYLSIGTAPRDTIKELHIKLGCEDQDIDKRKELYETTLEFHLQDTILYFHE